ncbi:putative ABC transport system permease protein [Filimonas zeae]|uniref:ABC transporter permease n=1 Tax=Filimonas zeae TaxID=1737353 RepID=A0A917MTZ5_9BACT|nr:ABC transporter permease [Filimonas zeae]MDR6339347.1 putative ABC transport system permease protein [Filimonas zeae]GGH64008.1 ABC transporter permease [Filimonas zeae]
MFRNYFKTAIRNLLRNKVYSFINIAGLAIGLACTMLILLYVKDELSFDRFHHKGPRLYRIVSKAARGGEERFAAHTGLLQGPRFTKNVAGIQSFVRIQNGQEDFKKDADVESRELLYVDSNFLRVFTFPVVAGNATTCLQQPHSVVLTQAEAEKQFGTTDAVGKVLMMRQNDAFVPYKVTAVTKNCPQNSSIQYRMLLPFRETEADAGNNENWFSFYLNTFVVLDEHANPDNVASQMQRFYKKDASETFNAMIARFGGGSNGVGMGTYLLQPFEEMHLSKTLPAQNGLQNASNPMYATILSGIALFVLLIACINFVNLTVARSVRRAREIGIRKVVGSGRQQLICQFLGESFTLCAIAFLLAIALAQVVLPVFNDLANKKLSITYLLDVRLVISYLALFVLTGLLAGFYPALVLSGYRPVETLYSRFTLKGKNYLQQLLVVLQFTLASFLIMATFIIYAQFNFLTQTDMGYNADNLILVNKNDMTHEAAATFKTELLKHTDIVSVAPKNRGNWKTGAKLANDSTIAFEWETVDEAYIPTLQIPLVQGRNFSTAYPADSAQSVVVNEAFVKQAGWKNPIGQPVIFNFHDNKTFQVIGVIKDYHYAPLNQEIGPQLFTMNNANSYGTFYIKIKPGTATNSLKYIQQQFKQFFPFTPYSYVFKEEEVLKSYEADARWKQIILFGAILTIFISCIGLFGLSVLSAEKRTKEIGIRKVLGASVQSIVTALSRDFVKLVIIALLIAVPIAWLAASKWLQNYPYRITPGWAVFSGAAGLVVLIALCTVSFQAVKAACANPVKSLRTDS